MKITLSFEEVSNIIKKHLMDSGKLDPNCKHVNAFWRPGNTIKDSTVTFEEATKTNEGKRIS